MSYIVTDYLEVAGGESYSDVIVEYGAFVEILDGGSVTGLTVESGGWVTVSSGGLATAIKENGGYIEGMNGASLTFDNNTISSLVVGGDEYASIHDATTVESTLVTGNDYSGGWLNIFPNAQVSNLTVTSNGQIDTDGIVTNVIATSNGYVNVRSGKMTSASVYDGGVGEVYYGDGVASETTVGDKGRFMLYGGAASKTTVCSGGSFVMQEAYDSATDSTFVGTAYQTTVLDGGTMRVVSNGAASGVGLSGGLLYVLSGAVDQVAQTGGSVLITGTTDGAGAMTNLAMTAGVTEIESGGSVTGATVFGGEMDVREAGLLADAILSDAAVVNIYGSASAIEMNGGTASVLGAVTTAVLNGGDFIVSSGALIQGATVNAGYVLDPDAESVLSGTVICGGTVNLTGTADDTLVTEDGLFNVVGGTATGVSVLQGSAVFDACVTDNVILGTDSDGFLKYPADPVVATLTLQNAGSIENLTVRHQGAAYLTDGLVIGATVTDYDAFLHVSEEGMANDVTVNGGTVYVSGGVLSGITLSGYAEYPVGAMLPLSHPVGAELILSDGAIATDAILNSASVTIGSDASLINATLNSIAQITVNDGGTLTGDVTILRDRNTRINVSSGGVIDFELSGATAGGAAKITNLLRVFGAPTYTLTVSADQARGVYCLTDCAGAFDSTIQVGVLGGDGLGTISLTDSIQVGNDWYSLRMNHGALEFRITAEAPELPQISVYVDTAWASLEAGTVVEVTGGTAIVGVTAFADGDDAMSVVAPDGVLTVLGGTVTFAYGIYRDTVAADGVLIADSDVLHGGSLVLQAGSTGRNLNIDEEAALTVDAGSTLTGTGWWEVSSDVVLNGVVDFDVSGSTGGNTSPYYNRLTQIDAGAPSYTVTIGETQANATYLLAYYPMAADTPVTLQLADGTVLGVFEQDAPIVYNEQAYWLNYNSGSSMYWLDLLVEEFIPTSEVTYVNSEWADLPKKTVVEVTGGTAIVGETAFATADRGALYCIEGGTVYITGGTASFSKTIKRNIEVQSGANLYNPWLTAGVSFTVDAGATVTVNGGTAITVTSELETPAFDPTAAFVEGSTVTFAAGSTLNFDIGGQNAPNATLLSGLSYAQGTPNFTLTVKEQQERGTYVLASDAAGFNQSITVKNQAGDEVGTLTFDNFLRYGNCKYYLNLNTDGSLYLLADAPDPVASDIDGNYVSDVMFVWTDHYNQQGYWMNGEADWASSNAMHPGDWKNLGCYDMTGDGKADSVMIGRAVGQTEDFQEVVGEYVGYYADGIDDPDGSTWVTLGFLENPGEVEWHNAIGNLTGGDANSLVWFSPDEWTLGVWVDGTDEWVTVTHDFGGDLWKLVGCGDFDGDGVDSIVMCHNGFQYYYVDLDGSYGQLSDDNTIWWACELAGIGDFSDDGKDDIILYEKSTGSLYMLADGNPDNYSSIKQLDPTEWYLAGVGDYNGDQFDDLLVRQFAGGTAVGYFAGADKNQWHEIGCGIGSNWSVIA